VRTYLSIGSSPPDEDCAQVGHANYKEKAAKECERYIKLIKITCGLPPENASLAIKSFPHDFGTYYEVVVYYDDQDENAINYAFHVEKNEPMTWYDNRKRIFVPSEK